MEIPTPKATVTVRVIDSTARIVVPNDFADKPIKGNEFLNCPSFIFLIEHSSGRRLLFDLGVRTDLDQLPPAIQDYFQKTNAKVSVEKDAFTILEENNVDPRSIEAVFWSHWHWDHVGDPSRFPSSTTLVVGPGFKQIFVPGYPTNPQCPILETDYENRELRELDFNTDDAVKIGNFSGIDYFGDGSFYLLDAPGHTIGHLCALAATTMSPPSYILMGADACHHPAEMRPSKWLPLPEEIRPNPFKGLKGYCPGAAFEHLLRNGDGKLPFYGQKRPGMVLCDPDVADQTIVKIQEADGNGNILVVLAHDPHIKDHVPLFPDTINDFLTQEWHKTTRWTFLSDFKPALREGVVLEK